MHLQARQQFNASFTEEKYHAFLHTMNTAFGEDVTFRICETPVFVPAYLKEKLLQGVKDICAVISRPDFKQRSEKALPDHLRVPGEDDHTTFLQLDFGICEGVDGTLTPQLIELQGFPSLYFFQHLLADSYRRHFDVPADFQNFFNGLDGESYIDLLHHTIIGGEKAHNVVLLEVEPEKQNTRIDFWGTRKHLGLKVLCLSDIKRDGRDLFYIGEEGEPVPIHRIYNRIIFDELEKRADLPREWNLLDEANVHWVGHPNWFFRISKYTLPFLKSPFVPETHFLSDLPAAPDDLENWVLKPLFSFSGMGVKINVTKEDLEQVDRPDQYILQRKVPYIPAVQNTEPGERSKCEIRMMLLWQNGWPEPRLVTNLVRISKGEMVGVRYNKGRDWVGASVAYFEP